MELSLARQGPGNMTGCGTAHAPVSLLIAINARAMASFVGASPGRSCASLRSEIVRRVRSFGSKTGSFQDWKFEHFNDSFIGLQFDLGRRSLAVTSADVPSVSRSGGLSLPSPQREIQRPGTANRAASSQQPRPGTGVRVRKYLGASANRIGSLISRLPP